MTALIPPKKPATVQYNTVEERITATGTWTKPATVEWVDVLVVGGGGGGGYARTPYNGNSFVVCGGGGAGGHVEMAVPVTGPVPLTIGSGGAGAANHPPPTVPAVSPLRWKGTDGGNTVFGSGPTAVTALGGGGGGGVGPNSGTIPNADRSGSNGGCGGGAGANTFGGRVVLCGGGGGASQHGSSSLNSGPATLFDCNAGRGLQNGGGGASGAAGLVGGHGGAGINGLAGGGAAGGITFPNPALPFANSSRATDGGGDVFTSAVANTGGGGSGGTVFTPPDGTILIDGQPGASGIAIVRYNI